MYVLKCNYISMKHTPQLDPKDRDLITMQDLKDAVRQLTNAPSERTKSENREPTKQELEQRYKLVRQK